MLLILPVFLTIVFTIMEMGYLAFWMIVLNHATFEVARIGSLIACRGSAIYPSDVTADMQGYMDKIIKGGRVSSRREVTIKDRQSQSDNYDLVVTGSYNLRFVFPMSSILMSSRLVCPGGPGGGSCTISATVRMPIETPVNK